ncbi:class II fructose-bisphosphate aldolase [Lacrimispora indolis]|uniref:class II fructose-bisphosphate aldolase n=1 Tax=Lacrimispora indolis TaxID=69825 RepID=UPI00041E8575|nr:MULTISPECIES: ketose-bisphosphate aldolase [Lachnospiraceae]MBE7721583.1 ketose-bisphosphate aldolase [Lacrimispora celerecrescens]
MPLVTSKKMLLDAQKGKYAVGAFNVENMEMVMAVIDAAKELQAPVILQTTPSTVKYGGLNLYYANVKAAAERASVPVALHLDHGSSFELAMQAFREGYTSIMIDGSHFPLEENAALSKSVADACHPSCIPVEGELGRVGGKEDDLEGGKGGLTSPDEAAYFVEKTGIDYLAVSIGTAHGVYSGVPNIRVDILKEIKKKVSIPLVLHGTSGLADETVRACIREGICKVNYATDLRIAFSEGVKAVLNENQSVIDPKTYGKRGREFVKQYVMSKISVCGSVRKAGNYE